MKIKSPIGFLALWSAFLAMGTWVLPMGLPLLSVGEAAHASAPVGIASESPFVGSEVDLAWRSATGQTIDIQSSVIAVVEGSAELPHRLAVLDLANQLISSETAATWIPLAGFEVFSDYAVHGDPSDGSMVHAVLSVRLVAGTVIGANGSSGSFVGATIGGDATVSRGSDHASVSTGIFLPLKSFATVDLALTHLAGLEAAASDPSEGADWPGAGCGDGSAGINCHNPNWVGNNGQQCCRYKMCRDQKIALCDKTYSKDLVICTRTGALGLCAVWAACIASSCKFVFFVPPLMKACALTCAGVTVGAGVLGALACIERAERERDRCYGEANDWYFDRVDQAGCSPKPNATPTAIPEILSEQKLEAGDGLQQALVE